jgi:toxin ParE1/3/4
MKLSEATAHLSQRSPGAAQRFLVDVDETIGLLRRFPRFGSSLHGDLGRLSLKVFPYRPIYHIESEEIVVYAVSHVRRRPGYWRKRIPR